VYHGTNQEFQQFEQSKSRVLNDFYGGGVAYFTNSIDIAHNYAKSMFNKSGGAKYVYEVELKYNKLFDVDKDFTGKDITQFFEKRSDIEDFARGASLLTASANKFDVISKLEDGAYNLKGDVVFKGISRGQSQSLKARELLKRLGYDTLRYNGGVNMQQTVKHDVFIAYYSNNIRITNRFMYDKIGNRYELKK
jgi:hypothetical protein